MKVDQNAPMTARNEVTIEAPAQRVWSTLTEIDRWPEWQSAVSSAQLEGPLAVGSRFVWKANGLKIASCIEDLEPSRRIGWTGKALGMNAIHTWKTEPQDRGTRVLSEESMSGWFIRLIGIFDRDFLSKSLAAALQELKARAEAN